MLVVQGSALVNDSVSNLAKHLRPGDALVVNDTRVIPARLFAAREVDRAKQDDESQSQLELLLVEKLDDTTWTTLVKPGRRAKLGSRWQVLDRHQNPVTGLEVVGRPDTYTEQRGIFTVRFDQPIDPDLEAVGHVPLPPYIQRPDTPDDRDRYQTVYAAHDGAIAAPTAGLHFNDELLGSIQNHGVHLARVTLHVGIGTFQPVTATLAHEHQMEPERYLVSTETAKLLNRTRQDGGRIVAVGTTAVRTLESVVDDQGVLHPGEGKTNLFILPGYRFRAIEALLTNFHLPKSTLLMLVSAFAGKNRVLNAYRHAVEAKYRFYSYGDCMFINPSA